MLLKNLRQWEASGHLYTRPSGDMKTKTYNVTFVGEYMCLTTTIEATNEDTAIQEAMAHINEQYGWDLEEIEIIDTTCERLKGVFL